MKSKKFVFIFSYLISIFSSSIFSYPYHFTRLYRQQDGTTVDLIYDVHVEKELNCAPTNWVLEKYRDLFTRLKHQFGDDLKIFWELSEEPPIAFHFGELLSRKRDDLIKEISGFDDDHPKDSILRFFNDLCLRLQSFCIYHCNFVGWRRHEDFYYWHYFLTYLYSFIPRYMTNYFLDCLPYFLIKKYGIEIIKSDCYRGRVCLFLDLCNELLSLDCSNVEETTIRKYFVCFMYAKMLLPWVIEEFDHVLNEQKSKGISRDLEILYSDFCSHKAELLDFVDKVEFSGLLFDLFFITQGDHVAQRIRDMRRKMEKLRDSLNHLSDFEMLFNILFSSSKRKILDAGSFHCNNVANYLEDKCNFVLLSDFGNFKERNHLPLLYLKKFYFDTQSPSFQRRFDGSTQYFSFHMELSFEMLEQALLQDPKVSFERRFGLSSQDNSQLDLEEPPTRPKRKIDEVSGSAEEREGNKRAREEDDSAGPKRASWCAVM